MLYITDGGGGSGGGGGEDDDDDDDDGDGNAGVVGVEAACRLSSIQVLVPSPSCLCKYIDHMLSKSQVSKSQPDS